MDIYTQAVSADKRRASALQFDLLMPALTTALKLSTLQHS
jgi:hypothetical protein